LEEGLENQIEEVVKEVVALRNLLMYVFGMENLSSYVKDIALYFFSFHGV
jgi:hypothetical protein